MSFISSRKQFYQTVKQYTDPFLKNFELKGIQKPNQLENVKRLLQQHKVSPTYLAFNQQDWQKNRELAIDLSISKDQVNQVDLFQKLQKMGIKCSQSPKIKVDWFPREFQDLNKMGFKLLTWKKDRYHQQFNDQQYVKRRQDVAKYMLNYKYGDQLPTIQYFPEEIALWTKTYSQLKSYHNTFMIQRYRVGLQKMQKGLGLDKKVPQLADISSFLESQTGFKVRPTHGILNKRDFLNSLAFRTIFSTQFIRNKKNPQFCPESDLIHQCLGHMPLLTDKYVADMIQKIGILSLGAAPEDIDRLSKVYWYLIQFGTCNQNGSIRGYGAGIASSTEQMENLKTAKFQRIDAINDCVAPYNDQKVLQTYRTTESLEQALQILVDFASNMPKPIQIIFDQNSKTFNYNRSIETLVGQI